MSEKFENSPEHETWVQAGGRDEEESYYRERYDRRIRLEDIEAEKKRKK